MWQGPGQRATKTARLHNKGKEETATSVGSWSPSGGEGEARDAQSVGRRGGGRGLQEESRWPGWEAEEHRPEQVHSPRAGRKGLSGDSRCRAG